MATSLKRYCVFLLLLTSIASSAGSDDSNDDAPREPRVTGRIVKLYSGAKPEPYVCPGEGFQLDPSNCASFFRCVQERNGKFTVFRYQCAPGTVYDPDLETCNHPRSTRRTECGGTLETTVVPHFTIKNNEIDGAQSEIPRPISTKEPVYTEQTTLKNPTTITWILSTERQNISTKMPWEYTKHSSPGISHSTSKFSDFITTKQWLFSTQRQTQTTSGLPAKVTQSSNFENSEPCTSDGFVGDSENCRIFYRCVGNSRGGYARYEFSCSESTVWDDEIQGCNHPWAVKRSKCGRSLTYDSKSATKALETSLSEKSTIINSTVYNGRFGYKTNKTIQQQLQISHGSEITQTQVQISNTRDVIQNQTQINFGDKVQNSHNSSSKQNQTQISHGTAVSQSQTQIDYGNKGIQTQLQIDHSIESSQYQAQIQESTTRFTTSMTNHDSNEKNMCSESGFMGDSNDCKKFYRCVNNGRGYTKYEYKCGEGTVWDPEIEACNHAWAVKQCGGKVTAEPTTEAHTTSTKKPTEYTPHTKTTTSYTTTTHFSDIDDEDNIGYGNQNSQETISTSTTTTRTTTTEKSATKKPMGNTTQCTNSGFMGDVNDCKIFYRCVDNGNGGFIKYEFKCGEGTVWDSNIEACNHAWAVKNCGGSSSTTADKEETTTKKYITTPSESAHTTVILVEITTQAPNQNDDHDTGYGSQNQDTLHSSTTTSKPTKQPEELDVTKGSECKSSGFIGDANDCKKFYRCVDNGNGGYIKYEFTCGQGTVWDSKIDACNHAWSVEKCGESNSIETSSQATTTITSGDTSTTYIHTTEKEKETDTSSMAPSTTVQSGTSNKCSSSGFMRDSSDCKRFYRCVDNGDGSYTRYEFTCGDGTVWDPKIEACNHVWAVEKCGAGAESSSKPTSQQTTAQSTIVLDDEQTNGYATPSYTDAVQSTLSTSSSTTTFTTTSESSLCRSNGFKRDKSNCKKFYRCVDNGKGDYDRYEFQCGEGTVWDESIEACNHAWAVKNCEGSETHTTHLHNENITPSITPSSSEHENSQASTEKITTTTKNPQETGQPSDDECKQEGFYGDKRDCKKFYRCVDNGKAGFTKYEFKCGDGTSWNQDIQGCDHISPNRLCGTSYEPLSDDMGAQPTTKSTTSAEATESNSPQGISKSQDSDGTCDSEGFYANPSDCKHFYRCVDNGNGGFTKFDFICGDGTTWNQEIQACDHESDKSCTSGSSSPTHTTGSQSESTTSAYSTTKAHDNTVKTTAAEITAEQCTSEGFFSHPNDCKKFVRCVDNGNKGYTQYEFSCSDGTVWVQEIQACDHDNDVNSCKAQVETISEPSNTDNNASSSSSSTGTSSTESMPPNKEYDEYDNEPSQNKNDICTSEGYFGNKQDCKFFYRCVDNGKGGFTKYDFVCGEGTAWDSDLQTCNHINEVQSCSGSVQGENGNHQATTNKNQVETEGTSSTTKATSSSELSSSNSNSNDTCESEGYFGDSKDCKKFYRCVDNGKGGYTKYDYTCGDGAIWDQDITTCNHPQDVSNPSCGSNQGTSDISSTTSSTISSSSTSSSTESSNNSQDTSDPTNNNVTCNKAGYYSNPNDCKKFYRCVDWDGDGQRFSVFHFECGEGTIWDPAVDTCNHEESVYPQRECSQTQNVGGQSTTEESTTTTTEESTTTTTEESLTTTTVVSTTTTTTEGSTSTTTESTTSAQTTQELTTQEPITSEKTTTEQSNEPTTTKQTTTSEKTTTQEPTTSEQTTTSEKTTTQESTSSEQTTTQQPTTSEQTTTQQSPSEQTTTQQTSSEQTTTQTSTSSESTTQESTTTQQSTTTDQTTTQESTTTQQSTTTDQTTTQESTTNKQSTSEQPITTTRKSTTSSETATEDSNESTTTEQSSDGTTTTQQSTDRTTTTEQTTTEETTDQSSTQTSSTESDPSLEQSTTEASSTTEESDKECPETDDDQYLLVCPTSFRRHPKYCNMFYQCTEDEETYEAKMAMFKCPNNTIYDETQTQCVSKDKAGKKCDGEIANKRRFKRLGSLYKEPIVADKGKKTCSTTGYFSFEKHSECAKGFLKCERSKNGVLQGYVYQCPDGFIYWSISKRCERLESVRDCKRSSNDWTGRWNIPVERNNIDKS